MDTQLESSQSWKRLVTAVVLVVIVLAAGLYLFMRGRVDDNAYFGRLNNYQQIDQ